MSAARIAAILALAVAIVATASVVAIVAGVASGRVADTATPGQARADETGPSASTSSAPLSPAEIAARTMTALEAIFVAEVRDDDWASTREAEIRAVRANERLGGVDSIDVECRTSICRVVVGLDPAQARRTLHALIVTPPLNTSGFHGLDPDDERKIRLFVSREGTALVEHPALSEALKLRG